MKTLAYKLTKQGLKPRTITYNQQDIKVGDGKKEKTYLLGVDLIRIKWSIELEGICMVFQLEEPKQIKFRGEINELLNLKTQLDGTMIYCGFKYFYDLVEQQGSQDICCNKLTNTNYHYQIFNFSDHLINCTQYHQNILTLMKTLNHSQSNSLLRVSEVYIENNALIIVYENYEQELRNYLISPQFQDNNKINMIAQLLKSVLTLHNLGIIHRNLCLKSFKLQNGQVKLSEFEFSQLENENQHIVKNCGTLGMIAPEIFQGSPYSKQSDIYSLGVIIHLCLTKKHIFPYAIQEMIVCNQTNNYILSEELSNYPVFQQMIPQMLKENAIERITLQQCINMIQQ